MPRPTDAAVDLIEKQKMTRFVFRNTIKSNPVSTGAGNGFAGAQISPFEAAQFMNAVQELSERTRLGIPALFKSNSRNHIEFDARAGINVESGSFSSWPKESGLAATRDMALIADFAKIMAEEWRAIGLRGMYGYMADFLKNITQMKGKQVSLMLFLFGTVGIIGNKIAGKYMSRFPFQTTLLFLILLSYFLLRECL